MISQQSPLIHVIAMKNNCVLVLIMVLVGLAYGCRGQMFDFICILEDVGIVTYKRTCSPTPSRIPQEKIDSWKKHPLVGQSREALSKEFGSPDGVYSGYKSFLRGSDETWVFNGEGFMFNRTNFHIFVFANGRCIAATDTYVFDALPRRS